MKKFAASSNLSEGGLIAAVAPQGLGAAAGIRAGERVLEVNGRPLRDVIDFEFYASDRPAVLSLELRGRVREVSIPDEDGPIGIRFAKDLFDGIRECENRCLFCFVHQLPRSLRPSLYVKDDDYRLSFLHGAFITATNLTADDRRRIVEQRLSPLFVSVHATDDGVRRQLLGNPEAPPIMAELQWFRDSGIEIHAQIVVCPGINDGPVLEKTIEDLAGFHPSVASVGVVPVGLTSHRRNLPPIQPVKPEMALRIVGQVREYQRGFLAHFGTRFVWASDELLLLAGRSFPPDRCYEDYPQLENGVGVSRLWLNGVRAAVLRVARRRHLLSGVAAELITGVLAAPMMLDFAAKLEQYDVHLNVHAISNRLFGPTVTTAGLLAGEDIADQVRGKLKSGLLLVPAAALRDGTFLDDVTLDDLSRELGVRVADGGRWPRDVVDALIASVSLRKTGDRSYSDARKAG